MRRRPLVSVVVCTKNGMPYIGDAMASLEAQTYRRFEVVVQDAESTDGTAAFLSTLPFDRLSVVSEPDDGIGDAYDRAFARCSGEIVTSLDADNLLEADALERAVAVHARDARAAALYGAVQMIAADASAMEVFVPAPFDAAALMRCELVPPFSTAFFSRGLCGRELGFRTTMRTCADFDLWLRISQHRIVRTTHVLGSTRVSAKSMTRDPSRYEDFCRDKVAALDRHLARRPELAPERSQALSGIYCWAAEALLALEGPSARCAAMLERALAAAPTYERVERLGARVAELLARSGAVSHS